MAQTKEDRLFLAYKVYEKQYIREGQRTPRAFAILEVCARFNMAVSDVRDIVNAKLRS